jgi:altronate dehydratase small subunit
MEIEKGKRVIRLTVHDNVATAVEDIKVGDTIHIMGSGSGDTTLVAKDEVQFGHKIALKDISIGEVIRKYGESIGIATEPIHMGEHVHTHNLNSIRAKRGG